MQIPYIHNTQSLAQYLVFFIELPLNVFDFLKNVEVPHLDFQLLHLNCVHRFEFYLVLFLVKLFRAVQYEVAFPASACIRPQIGGVPTSEGLVEVLVFFRDEGEAIVESDWF